MPHDIEDLERKLKALGDTIARIHDAKHADHLITIIHRPGWTTPREEELVESHIVTLHNHANNLHSELEMLVNVAEKIGKS